MPLNEKARKKMRERINLSFTIQSYKNMEDELMAGQGAPVQEKERMLTVMFTDRESAEKAYEDLRARGYSENEINVIMSDKTRDKYFKNTNIPVGSDNKALEGTGTGSIIGGTL